MKKLSALLVIAGLVAGTTIGLAPGAIGQEQFPNEPGRDTLFLVCTQCHSLGKMVAAELTADDWQFVVYDMISRGAPVEHDDVEALTTYLQNNFAKDRR